MVKEGREGGKFSKSNFMAVNLQCREIAVSSHNEMTKVATELHSVSIFYLLLLNAGCFFLKRLNINYFTSVLILYVTKHY